MRIAITGSSGLIGGAPRPIARGRRPRGGAGRARRGRRPAPGTRALGHRARRDRRRRASRASTASCTWPARASARSAGPTSRSARSSRAARRAPACSPTRSPRSTPSHRCSCPGAAIGVYGDRGDEQLTEASAPGTGFLAEVVVAWEAAAAPAEAAGIRVPRIRTGIVLDAARRGAPAAGPALPLRDPRQARHRQAVDELDQPRRRGRRHPLPARPELRRSRGPVNLTAPAPVTNEVFTKALGRVLHRPTFLPVPSFGPKLLLGSELAESLLYEGQRVAARRAPRRRLRVPPHRPRAHAPRAARLSAAQVTSAACGRRRRRGWSRRSCSCSTAARAPSTRTRRRCRAGRGRARRASASP